MSWSVSAAGAIEDVRGRLSEQFKGPLAEKPAGLSDDGERVTVEKVAELLEQILSTFDTSKEVNVSAYGHMGFSSWETKEGCYQSVNISIGPNATVIIK